LNVSYDLGILTLFATAPLKFDVTPGEGDFNQKLKDLSLKNIKLLIKKLYSLKSSKEETFDQEVDDYKIYDYSKTEYDIKLPDCTTVIPRFKKLPDERKLTRWEKFASEKGIKRKKRGRMLYDEITKAYAPRWGANSIKKVQDKVDIIREHKAGDDPKADPFEKNSLKKTLEKSKQKLREVRNQMEAKGLKPNSGKMRTSFKEKAEKKKKDKQDASKVLQVAQKSTASMGLFDKKAHREEPEIKKKRKNNVQPFKSGDDEKRRNLDILDYVSKVKAGK